MAYTRKTRDVWNIEGDYGQGWEVVTAEETFLEAREMVKCYRENEPDYPHRIHMVREPIASISTEPCDAGDEEFDADEHAGYGPAIF